MMSALRHFMRHAVKSIESNQPSRRALVLFSALVFGVSLASAFAFFGTNLKPGNRIAIPTIGIIERIRLPSNTMSMEAIRSFQLRVQGGNDYFRIFVNNYVVVTNEDRSNFGMIDAGPRNFDQIRAERLAVNRGDTGSKNPEIRPHLLRGENYIILELENGYLGCGVKIDLLVNGNELEGFPESFPESPSLDAAALNPILVDRFEFLRGSAMGDSFCTRRVWEFFIR